MKIYQITRYGKFLSFFEIFEHLPLIKGTDRFIYGENESDAIEFFKQFYRNHDIPDEVINSYQYEAKQIGYLDNVTAYDLNGNELES